MHTAKRAGVMAPRPHRLTLDLPLPPRNDASKRDEMRRRADMIPPASSPSEPTPPNAAPLGTVPSPRAPSPETFEETAVDFANAALYITGIQTVFSICCCATVSVIACSLVPMGNVSAVRTLVFCVLTAVVLMRKPLRVGRARGVSTVFTALQPAAAIYLLSLIIEQLLHTCTGELGYAPSWRRAVFHVMIAVMIASGFMRARAPLDETDLPFLLTAGALAVIALVPPPALAFTGPLCQSVDLWSAADRLVRAFAFSSLYCIHVFVSTDSTTVAASETILVVARSTASSIWVMGAYPALLPIAIAQATVAILARLRIERKKHGDAPPIEPPRAISRAYTSAVSAVRGAISPDRGDVHEYALLGTPPPPHASDSDPDLEAAGFADEISPQAQAVVVASTAQRIRAPEPLSPPEPPPPEPLPPEPKSDAEERKETHTNGIVSFKQAGFREIGGAVAAAAAPMTAERMAQIAASIAD